MTRVTVCRIGPWLVTLGASVLVEGAAPGARVGGDESGGGNPGMIPRERPVGRASDPLED
jgi:hypothetical protein